MLEWKPPRGTTVLLRFRPYQLRAPTPSTATPSLPLKRDSAEWYARREEQAAYRAKLAALIKDISLRFRLPHLETRGATLSVTDQRWPRLIDAAEEAYKQGVGIDMLRITEPNPSPSPDAWYRIEPSNQPFRLPFKMRPSAHLARKGDLLVGSSRFVDAVRRAGLTGLDNLPLVDVPENDPLTWEEVFATNPVGRGLDHVLYYSCETPPRDHDPQDIAREWALLRQGMPFVRSLPPSLQLPKSPLDLARLGPILERHAFRVEGRHRLVRENLPATDFAYDWWGGHPREQLPGRHRGLLCNDHARRELIKTGVMQESAFTAYEIVDERDADVEVLDRLPLPLPLPSCTPEEAAAARMDARSTQSAAPRLQFNSLEEAESYLKDRLAQGTASWKPLQAGRYDQLTGHEPSLAPRFWRALMPYLPQLVLGRSPHDVDGEFGYARLAGSMDKSDWNGDEGPLTGDIEIGSTGNGDWFAIRPGDPAMPDDARVSWWNHETLMPHDEWPSILAFVADIIATCDRLAEKRRDSANQTP